MSSVFASLPPRASLASVLTDCDVPPVRVLCTGGVVWRRVAAGRWRVEGTDDPGDAADATPDGGGIGSRATHSTVGVDRWLRACRLRPIALAVPDVGGAGGVGGERLVLVSAVGAIGWRPPLALLGAHGSPALRRFARQVGPLLDAAEQHALDAAERYARAAAGAGRAARLFGAPALRSVAAAPGLFVAVDALSGAGLRTLAAADEVTARAFGRSAAGAPAELRAALLEVRVAHAVPAIARRRALRRRAGVLVGAPSVQVRRLPGGAERAAGAWAVRIPVGGVDALDAAWALATGAWRALTLAVYVASGAWAVD